jgi:hypothetical protein
MADGNIFISLGASIRKLNSNGALDPNLIIWFDSTFELRAYVSKIIRGPTNTLWVAGMLRGMAGTPLQNNLVRISTSGAILAKSEVYWEPVWAPDLYPLDDGGLLIGTGSRIRADGTRFGRFEVGGTAVAMDKNGDIIVGGGSFLFAARMYGEASATPVVFNPNTQSNRWQITGYPGSTVEIDASHDLLDWRSQTALTLTTSGQATFELPINLSNTFFRAKLRR